MTDLNQTVQTIEQLLLQEQASPIKSRADIGASELRRKELHTLLRELQSVSNRLSNQIHSLPDHPNKKEMSWAEAALSMPNTVILVFDTTSLARNADIIRVHALSVQGALMLDMIIRPQRELTPNTAWTGISESELSIAPTLEEAWTQICSVLRGCFIISFSLEWVRSRLENNIEYYGLSRLPLLGDCLMERAKNYFGIESHNGLKLPDAVARIGKPFPYSPPLAADRAAGCLHLLTAMSQGVTSAPKLEIDTNTDLDEIKDHPF